MPEWLVERGIGETRAALVDDGEIIEARIELEGTVPAGSVIKARLANIGNNGRNAIAVGENGTEYVIPAGAPGVSQGATLAIEISREAMPGAERWKRPLARTTGKNPDMGAPLVERLAARKLVFPSTRDELGDARWNDVIDEARAGVIGFAGGELRVSATPAMTLIDVDGYPAPADLALLGATAAAQTIRRLDIGGSIGIDLPTTRNKAARLSAAEAIDAILPQPFERTAVNGFGFVQIVRPRSRASLVELALDRPQFEARALLRRVAFEPAGPKRLVGHPALIAAIEAGSDWLAELSKQVGGVVSLRADPSLPMSGGYAENV